MSDPLFRLNISAHAMERLQERLGLRITRREAELLIPLMIEASHRVEDKGAKGLRFRRSQCWVVVYDPSTATIPTIILPRDHRPRSSRRKLRKLLEEVRATQHGGQNE